jgi:hypothetical protein
MNNKNLLVYGAVAVGAIFLYNRYAKKGTNAEESQGGGGGGGGFGPMPPLPPIAPVVNPNQGRSYTADQVTREKVYMPVTKAMSSGTGVTNSGTGVSNTGGFNPIPTGGSPLPPVSTGTVSQSQMNTGLGGGAVFKLFDGDNGRLRLENLVRSFNRP